jgi:hypothetical protein
MSNVIHHAVNSLGILVLVSLLASIGSLLFSLSFSLSHVRRAMKLQQGKACAELVAIETAISKTASQGGCQTEQEILHDTFAFSKSKSLVAALAPDSQSGVSNAGTDSIR